MLFLGSGFTDSVSEGDVSLKSTSMNLLLRPRALARSGDIGLGDINAFFDLAKK